MYALGRTQGHALSVPVQFSVDIRRLCVKHLRHRYLHPITELELERAYVVSFFDGSVTLVRYLDRDFFHLDESGLLTVELNYCVGAWACFAPSTIQQGAKLNASTHTCFRRHGSSIIARAGKVYDEPQELPHPIM
jgi:hypothetical protein